MSGRELVDAAAFQRRRLVAAFLTGTADERLLPRAGRWIVAGALLTAVLLAGAAATRLPVVAEHLPWR